jgi:uncharacterized protein YndB with AHSA1/START domain
MRILFWIAAFCSPVVSVAAADSSAPYRIVTEVKPVEGSPLQVVTSEAHYPYPPEKVWEVLTDFASFPKYLPRVTECQSLGLAHGTEQIYFAFSLPFPLANLWNIVAMAKDPKALKFEWDLLQGNINTNRGKLWVEPEEGGSVVRMNIQVDVGSFLPQWVIRIGAKMYLPKVLRAFGDRFGFLNRPRT